MGISISPTSASVRVKTTKQFTATVTNTSNTSVIWKVNGVTGGNSTFGIISTSGLYKAPSNVPAESQVSHYSRKRGGFHEISQCLGYCFKEIDRA